MPTPIQIIVGEHKSLVITIPHIAKNDLMDIIGNFFSRGDERAKERFTQLLPQSGEITLVLTTKECP